MTLAPTRRHAGVLTAIAGSEPVAMRLRLIGQMEAWTLTSDSVLPVGRKTRALLAILALSAPRPVLRGRLAEMLWSKRPEEQSRASLRQEIHRLLVTLGSVGPQVLQVSRDHLSLRPGSAWVDVDEVMRATPGKPAGLSLLDGDLLEDLDGVDPAFDGWLAAERERLRDKARTLAEILLRDQTDPAMAILAAQQLLAIDRTHEGAWRALMRAHVLRGERGMAIQAYERCRAALADLLDAEPSDDTQRLIAEIRAGGAARAAAPPLAARPESRPESRPDSRPEPRPESRATQRPELRPESRSESRPEPRGEAAARSPIRVGVLPLLSVGLDSGDAPIGTALAEEIAAGLARSRWMMLVSPSALARLAAQTRDEAAFRRAFDLQYLLDGTLQRVQQVMRVSLRLLDLRAGNLIIWSGRYEADAADLMGLIDSVAARAAAQVAPELMMIEAQRAAARPGTDLSAADMALRALALSHRMERPSFFQAGELLRRATVMDPSNATAYASLAFWHVQLASQDWAMDREDNAAQSGRHAERAMALDPQDARVMSIAGHVREALQRRLPEASALHERALALNPYSAMGWALAGTTCGYRGNLDAAEQRLQRYKVLAPLHPQSFVFDPALCAVALLAGDAGRAAAIGRGVSQLNLLNSEACKPYLAALGHAGLAAEAAMVRDRLLEVEPHFTVRRFLQTTPYDVPAHRTRFADGLRAAGIAEG